MPGCALKKTISSLSGLKEISASSVRLQNRSSARRVMRDVKFKVVEIIRQMYKDNEATETTARRSKEAPNGKLSTGSHLQALVVLFSLCPFSGRNHYIL